MNKTFVRAVMLVLAMSSLAACKIGRKPVRRQIIKDTTFAQLHSDSLSKTTDSAGNIVATLTPEKQRLIDSLQPVWKQEITYTTFSGKAKMHYDDGRDPKDFIANFRVKKDSVIWIAITAPVLSLQVARVYITPDSFRLINYLQKTVTLMPIADVKKLLPADVDFNSLQNLIVGNALRNFSQPTDATDFGGTWSVQMEDSAYIQQLSYNKSDSSMRTSQLRTRRNGGPAAIIQYGNYYLQDSRHFADSRAINIVNGNDQYYLDMNFSNASFDQPADLTFSIPKKYTIK